MSRGRSSLWGVFRIPTLLAALTVIGLTAGVVGDGVWDALSWLTLGLPLFVMLWRMRACYS